VLTLNTLGFFSLSLFAQAIIPLLTRVFYSRHNSKTPFFVGLLAVVINIILSLWLAPKQGIEGLAIAFSISSILNFIILWLALRFELGYLDEIKILKSTLKFSLAALLAGFIMQSMKVIIAPLVDMTRLWGVMTQGAMAGLLGILVYLIICYLLRSEELFSFLSSIKRRLFGIKVEAVDRGEARGI